MRDHITAPATQHVPLLLHGPIGSGKTCGVGELLAHLGLRAVYLDAVEADDTAQLSLWIRRTRESRTLEQKSVVVVDDLEGFTANARAEVCKLAQDKRRCLNPLLLVVHARRDPLWKALLALPDVRLGAPPESVLYAWFRTHFVWTSFKDESAQVGLPHIVVDAERDLLRTGDVRRLVTAFTTRIQLGRSLARAHDVHVANVFDASRRLLRHTLTAEAWVVHTDPRDCTLLQHHLASVAGDDLDRLAGALDVFSCVDGGMYPARYDAAQHTVAAWVQAEAARLTSRTRDVGALGPPPRPPTRTRPEPETLKSLRFEE